MENLHYINKHALVLCACFSLKLLKQKLKHPGQHTYHIWTIFDVYTVASF